MCEPHAIPILDRRADVLAVDIPMLLAEAGIPQSGVHSLLMRKIGCLLDRMTEAGRAHHRAIRTGEAATRHLIPSRVLMGIIEGLRESRSF